MKDLNTEEFKKAIEENDDAVVIDVRTPAEIADGVIPGAMHIDIFDTAAFQGRVEELDKSRHYYIYCRSGNRSGQACRYMDAKGFNHTYNLAGGMNEWSGPVEQHQES